MTHVSTVSLAMFISSPEGSIGFATSRLMTRMRHDRRQSETGRFETFPLTDRPHTDGVPERRLTAVEGHRVVSWADEVPTVMRWEKERELPIHRGPGGTSGVVFADTDQLDAWTRGAGGSAPESDPPRELPVRGDHRPAS